MFGRICHESWAKSENSSFEMIRGAGRVGRQTGAPRTLQIEEQRPAIGRRSGRARRRERHIRAVRAADGIRPEASRSRWRRVSQETRDAPEHVTSGEEAAKHLIVQRVHPLAADLEGVCAGDERDAVLQLCAPDELVHIRLEEERIAESKRRAEADAGVGGQSGPRGRPRPALARVREVRLVHHPCRQRREPVDVHRR